MVSWGWGESLALVLSVTCHFASILALFTYLRRYETLKVKDAGHPEEGWNEGQWGTWVMGQRNWNLQSLPWRQGSCFGLRPLKTNVCIRRWDVSSHVSNVSEFSIVPSKSDFPSKPMAAVVPNKNCHCLFGFVEVISKYNTFICSISSLQHLLGKTRCGHIPSQCEDGDHSPSTRHRCVPPLHSEITGGDREGHGGKKKGHRSRRARGGRACDSKRWSGSGQVSALDFWRPSTRTAQHTSGGSGPLLQSTESQSESIGMETHIELRT